MDQRGQAAGHPVRGGQRHILGDLLAHDQVQDRGQGNGHCHRHTGEVRLTGENAGHRRLGHEAQQQRRQRDAELGAREVQGEVA